MANFGFLNLNKPAQWTSHDCVAKIRGLLKIKRVGHGGTLDPAATGVLPIAIGKATRLLPFLPEKKAYITRIRFGVRTNTDDLDGEIMQTENAENLSLEQVQPHLTKFIGTIEQIPPAYSAISQGGKRLYQLARKGELVTAPSRLVQIYELDVLAWYPGKNPELELLITCGAGTYIRSIARDLGELLQVGATLANLTRTNSCGLDLSNSLTLQEIEIYQNHGNLSLISPKTLLLHLPLITLSDLSSQRWCQGQQINLSDYETIGNDNLVQVCEENGQFLGIGEVVTLDVTLGRDRILKPKVVLS